MQLVLKRNQLQQVRRFELGLRVNCNGPIDHFQVLGACLVDGEDSRSICRVSLRGSWRTLRVDSSRAI